MSTTLALAPALQNTLHLAYLLAAVCFIMGLKMMSQVKTARRGNCISAIGMLVAVVATFFYLEQGQLISLTWVAAAVAVGAIIGLLLAIKTPMTGMPQMVALLNGFGGMASMLVAMGDYYGKPLVPGEHIAWGFAGTFSERSWDVMLAIGLTVLVGAVTFSGSMVAFGKLQGLKITPGKPVLFRGQKPLNALILIACVAMTVVILVQPYPNVRWISLLLAALALLLGVLLVIPIGGADMPVVICLLNSYSGIAGAFAGFVLHNMALIITGSLVGASGIILCQIMCKAMNRSLANVLFGGVGFEAAAAGATTSEKGTVRTFTVDDAVITFASASQVMIVPGYGMAVAQAQHAVKDLADVLEERGIRVRYAIHPVAGRMPGHMNVLLAEADVPYEHLLDLDQSNAEFDSTDVALVIGANDVTNPAARHAKSSPIYGMPILDVDKARNILVIKRSLNPGFAGIENELYFDPKCAMLFGDAKGVVTQLLTALKRE